MPSQPHVLVTFGGTFGTGADAEIWQCGVKMIARASDGSAAGAVLRDLTAYVSSVQAGLKAAYISNLNWIRSDFFLGWVKAANIGGGSTKNPYGKYTGATDEAGGPNPASFLYSPAQAGGSSISAGVVPQILTLAATLRNKNAPRGPRHSASHGRLYLPIKVTSNTDRVGATDATNTVSTAVAILNALAKTAVTMNYGPLIGDQTVDLRPGLVGVDGTVRLVDRVEAGDVLDTVRNRKDKLREVYRGSDYV